MRNLRITHHRASHDELDRPPSACCWDPGSNSIICTFGPSERDTLVELKRWPNLTNDSLLPEPQIITSWDALCPLPELSCDRIVSLQFFPDTSTACLVFAGGDIVLVRERPQEGEERIEIVGSIDTGIKAAVWSPDEELLAICTRSDTVLFMTRDFDSPQSTNLAEDDLKASKHVSVGWGKVETQFKGRGARALRDPTVPEKVDEGLPSSHEDHATSISWRGDGQFVAINSTQKTSRRVIRVYTRDGVLDGVTEPVDYLESALSWRLAGNLIASVQRTSEQVQVIFFERNGLRHGQFPLRLTNEDQEGWASRISLSWNIDSTVLAIGFLDRIQLWTMGNYHYYLKQEIHVPSESGPEAQRAYWHPENPLSMAAGSSEGDLNAYEFVSSVSQANTSCTDSYGAVGVVDGAILKLTPMRYSNIPPPLGLHDVDIGNILVDVAFHDIGHKRLSIVALTVNTLAIYDWDLADNSQTPDLRTHCVLSDLLVTKASGCFVLQQVIFLDRNNILVLHSNGHSQNIDHVAVEHEKILLRNTDRDHLVQEIVPHPGSKQNSTYTIRRDGKVIVKKHERYGSDDVSDNLYVHSMVPEVPTAIEQCHAVQPDPEIAVILVSLTKGGHLYANKHRLASGCTSFLVSASHVIFTTTQNLLKFIHITHIEDLDVPLDTPELDERCRAVERGARLVTVIPAISAVVLQMPRGNLETIYPRALVLAEIRREIDHRLYLKAFKACRTHRVDMNIIHDYNPEQFISDVPLFIEKVRKVEYIDLFLSQLREEDVSISMYKETLRRSSSKNQAQSQSHVAIREGETNQSKVNRVCNAFLKALRPLGTTNLQNLITSHVCKIPPDLASGLKEVSKLQKEDPNLAELAVEHICFLADVNKLFDAALGLYDMKLALLVAQQAQKDPKEYLPFLQGLSQQEPLRMKFEIDNHLGRYRLCLEHLKDLEVFEEFKAFMVKHEFFGEAMSMYKYHEQSMQDIMTLYAEFLSSRSRHQEAGDIYEYLADYTNACESYRLANSWRESLTCASAIPLASQEVQSLAASLANGMVELKDYRAAAIINVEYLNDIKSAAQLFCKGCYFADAMRILSLHNKRELIESVVDAGLIEGMAAMTEMLAECKAQLNAQVPRIRELRAKKEEDPLSFYDADANAGAEIPDNVSLAGTDASTVGSTLFTRYTNRSGTVGTNTSRRTSKNKRREERKRARGKKGSVYEEEYLVNSIGRLIERANSVGDEVNRLVVGLVRRRMIERARAVENAMLTLVELCKACVPEVFQVEQSKKNVKPAAEGGDESQGADGVFAESMEELRRGRAPPTVKAFEGLGFLNAKS